MRTPPNAETASGHQWIEDEVVVPHRVPHRRNRRCRVCGLTPIGALPGFREGWDFVPCRGRRGAPRTV